jgi:hypothetical protein
MITARQIREHLSARPFRPLRLFLSDGSSHDVPHPEFAWVFGSSVFVGVSGRSTKHPEDFVKEIAILHITRIEKLPAERAK